MNKLKTLNDFDIEKYHGEYCFKANSFKKDLKQEGIKWVKNAREIKEPITEEIFMDFHNITEEDLNNG